MVGLLSKGLSAAEYYPSMSLSCVQLRCYPGSSYDDDACLDELLLLQPSGQKVWVAQSPVIVLGPKKKPGAWPGFTRSAPNILTQKQDKDN
jgi:hypothetical protein